MRSFNRGFLFSIYLVLIATSSILGSGEKTEKSNIPLLVETRWLAENRCSFKLRIVDYGRTARDYRAGHIPGATFVDKRTVWDKVDGIPCMVPAVKTVVETLEEASISNDNTVVIYDSAGGLWASRLFWALQYLGHRDVHILNGGWNKWLQEGHEVQMGVPAASRGNFIPQIQPDLLASKEWILENLGNPEVQLVDARSPKEYTGEGLMAWRGGHIPGAVNINWVHNLRDDSSKTFLREDELAKVYDSVQVSKDKVAVTYCHSGVRAAHTYFVLKLLGYPKVRLYDGSWSEWGNDSDVPKVTGKSAR